MMIVEIIRKLLLTSFFYSLSYTFNSYHLRGPRSNTYYYHDRDVVVWFSQGWKIAVPWNPADNLWRGISINRSWQLSKTAEKAHVPCPPPPPRRDNDGRPIIIFNGEARQRQARRRRRRGLRICLTSAPELAGCLDTTSPSSNSQVISGS